MESWWIQTLMKMEWMRRRIRMQEPMPITSRLHRQRLERQWNGFDRENYNISYATGDLTINRRAITLTARTREDLWRCPHIGEAFTTLDKDGDSVLPNGDWSGCVDGFDAGTYADSITPTATGAATLTGSILIRKTTILYATGDLTINRRTLGRRRLRR